MDFCHRNRIKLEQEVCVGLCSLVLVWRQGLTLNSPASQPPECWDHKSYLPELSFSKAHKVQGKPSWWKTLWGGGQGHGSVDTPGTGASFCGHQGLAHFQSRLRWSSALNNGAPFYISDRLSSLPSSLPSFLSLKSPHPKYWSLYPLLPPYSTVPTSPETFRVTSL